MIKVTVWNEYLHEKSSNEVAGVYPAGIHGCIKNFLSTQEDMTVRTATLSQRHCVCPTRCSTTPMCSFGGVTRLTTRCLTSSLRRYIKGLSPAWGLLCSIRVIIPRYSAR